MSFDEKINLEDSKNTDDKVKSLFPKLLLYCFIPNNSSKISSIPFSTFYYEL